jgi:hypothetical protein
LSASLAVPALAITVAEQQFGRPLVGSAAPLIVNVGNTKTAAMNTIHTSRNADGIIAFSGPQGSVEFAGKNVLIGSLVGADRKNCQYRYRPDPTPTHERMGAVRAHDRHSFAFGSRVFFTATAEICG